MKNENFSALKPSNFFPFNPRIFVLKLVWLWANEKKITSWTNLFLTKTSSFNFKLAKLKLKIVLLKNVQNSNKILQKHLYYMSRRFLFFFSFFCQYRFLEYIYGLKLEDIFPLVCYCTAYLRVCEFDVDAPRETTIAVYRSNITQGNDTL